MTPFLIKILPLYILVSLGWLSGRYLKISGEAVANLLIYTITPVVFFGSISQLHFSPTLFLCMAIPWVPALLAIRLMRRITSTRLGDVESRIVASSSAVSNGGYFGIPLYILFFGESNLGIWMLLVVGSTLFELTVSYYQLARSNFSPTDSIKRVLQLPVFWVAFIGLAYAASGAALPQMFLDLHREFRGAYLVLGMMMIGISLSTIKIKEFWSLSLFLGTVGRLIVYPVLMSVLIWIDASWLHILNAEMQHAALLFGFLPTAANTIAYTTQLGLPSEKTGSIVFVTTILCTIFVPVLITVMPN